MWDSDGVWNSAEIFNKGKKLYGGREVLTRIKIGQGTKISLSGVRFLLMGTDSNRFGILLAWRVPTKAKRSNRAVNSDRGENCGWIFLPDQGMLMGYRISRLAHRNNTKSYRYENCVGWLF